MNTNIAYINSPQRFELVNLNQNSQSSHPIEEIAQHDIHLFCVGESISEETTLPLTEEWAKFSPVIYRHLPEEHFELKEFILDDEFKSIAKKWTFQNNLRLIEQFFARVQYLKELLKTDRNSFMQELHFLLTTQLTCSGAMLFYQDLEQKKEEEAPQLVKRVLVGRKITQSHKASEQEEKLFDYYKAHFSEEFNIIDLELTKEALTFSCVINGSPLLAMIKIKEFNSLQKSLLEGLFRAF